MCLKLFRNFVRARLPPHNTKEKKGHSNGDANGLHCKRNDLPFAQRSERPPPFTWDVSENPLDELPFAGPEEPETPIDPSKGYFSALPPELKLEILEHFREGYTIPMGIKGWDPRNRRIVPKCMNMKALKAVRLVNREFSKLAALYLFAVANLNPSRRRWSNWLQKYEQDVLPHFGSCVRFLSVYIDDENDPLVCKVLSQLPNVQWLLLDIQLQSYSETLTNTILTSFPHIRRLSVYCVPPQLNSTFTTQIRILEHYGRILKSLEIFCDWNISPPEEMFTVMRENATSLQYFYIYCTRMTILGDIFTKPPYWDSRNTLVDVHLEECAEMDAWVVADMVKGCPALKYLNISSCGGPGSYGDAEGRASERRMIVKKAQAINRPPLESLRIEHATDVEFRHMCRIPTKKLLVSDPLDQLLLGDLLCRKEYFPGLRELELQSIMEPGPENVSARSNIKDAIKRRGDCIFKEL